MVIHIAFSRILYAKINKYRNLKAFIPNLITLLNLLMGCIAVILAAHGYLVEAGIFVGLGIFFDFFDGLAARLLKVSSELGKQLDSLADVVTSGVVPGIVMFQLLKDTNNYAVLNQTDSIDWYAYFGFLITLSSAYRLAKFNIDERQTHSFIGLPTPANAIFILSLVFILEYGQNDFILNLIENKTFLIITTLVSSFALNMSVELFSLKLKNFNFSENKFVYVLVIVSIVLIYFFQFIAVPIIIALYILMSIFKNLIKT